METRARETTMRTLQFPTHVPHVTVRRWNGHPQHPVHALAVQNSIPKRWCAAHGVRDRCYRKPPPP